MISTVCRAFLRVTPVAVGYQLAFGLFFWIAVQVSPRFSTFREERAREADRPRIEAEEAKRREEYRSAASEVPPGVSPEEKEARIQEILRQREIDELDRLIKDMKESKSDPAVIQDTEKLRAEQQEILDRMQRARMEHNSQPTPVLSQMPGS